MGNISNRSLYCRKKIEKKTGLRVFDYTCFRFLFKYYVINKRLIGINKKQGYIIVSYIFSFPYFSILNT